jgi:diaminopimelate epimerase
VRFAKGHGTGNDFVLVPDREGVVELTPERVRALCDRRTGLGADGVLRVAPGGDAAGWFMDYRNADGSVAEMCGNGVRVFGRWLVDEGWAAAGRLELMTRAGIRAVDVPTHGDPCVDMGPPTLSDQPDTVTVTIDGVPDKLPATAVDMGNPHLVAAVETVADIGWDGVPEDVNVEVIERLGPRALRMRVHERGVGETRSCGTGACAAVVAASGWAGDALPVTYTVDVPGGRLTVTWTGTNVLLAGAAVIVAEGDTSL